MLDFKSQFHRLIAIILSFLVSAVAFLFAVEKVYNYDIWWHLKTGQWIVENGKVPHTDPFTFATPDAPWQPHYWLSDVFFALIQRIGGIDWLILFKALIIAIAFLIIFRLMLRQGVNPFLAAALVLLVVPVARFRFLLRPHVFMFLLTAACFWILSEWGRERNRKLFWLLPLMLLWVNLHGSFFLDLVLVGCLLTEALILAAYTRYHKKDSTAQWPGFLVLLFVLLLIMTLISPFGLNLFRWVVMDFTLKNVTRTIEIEEHASLVWGEHQIFWGLMLATAGSFLLTFRKSRIFHFLVFGATSFLAIRGVRFLALAALLQAPILGYNLQVMLDSFPANIYRPPRWLQAVVTIPVLILGSVLLFKYSFTDTKVYRFGLGVNESRYPGTAVNFLRQINPTGNVYNSWEFGGYLLWELPDRKIFWDGRFLDAQSKLFEQLNTTPPMEFSRLFDCFDIRAAILSLNDDLFITYFSFSKDFQLVYFDDQALIYLAQDALPSERKQELGFFELIHPESYDFSYLASYVHSADAPKVEEELQRAVTLAPQSFRTHFFLGFFLETLGRWPEALEQYLVAAQINPRLAFGHYALGRRVGRLALHVKEKRTAIQLLREAVLFDEDGELLFLLGTSLYQAGQIDEAEEVYLDVLDREPQQVSCLVNLGYLYFDAERFQEAEQMQHRALKTAPNNEEALFGLALTLQKEGKREEAIQCWQEFLEKHPQSRWKEKAKMYLSQLTLQTNN